MYQPSNTSFLGKEQAYAQLRNEARAMLAGESDEILKMATLCALIKVHLPYAYWVGFYRQLQEAPGRLIIGPYQGTPACFHIDFERGVCGRAARLGAIQIVEDVHEDPEHLACDALSRSEIVLPVWDSGRLLAVLDLDSTDVGAFDQTDALELQGLLAEHFKA